MYLSKAEREELNALSLSVYGVKSRWQKLVEKGYPELLTEETEELVPAEKEGEEPTKRTVRVPVLKNGSQQYTLKRHTFESVKQLLTEQKTRMDEIRAQIKKLQEDAAEKKKQEELAKKMNEELGGSAGL